MIVNHPAFPPMALSLSDRYMHVCQEGIDLQTLLCHNGHMSQMTPLRSAVTAPPFAVACLVVLMLLQVMFPGAPSGQCCPVVVNEH